MWYVINILNHCLFNVYNLPAHLFYGSFPSYVAHSLFSNLIWICSVVWCLFVPHLHLTLHASSSAFIVVLEFTLKVYTVWRVMLCLLLTLLSDPLWSLWATEYFNALLIIDYEAEAKENRSPDVVFVPDMSKQLIDLRTSKSFYFWKSLCVNPLMPAVCTCLSFHRVYRCLCVFVGLWHCQHVWHHENGMTCDAFNVWGKKKKVVVRAASKFVCFILWVFFFSFWMKWAVSPLAFRT